MSDLESTEGDQSGISRRKLIKRGAVVGGLAWSAPVIVGSFGNVAGAAVLPTGSADPECSDGVISVPEGGNVADARDGILNFLAGAGESSFSLTLLYDIVECDCDGGAILHYDNWSVDPPTAATVSPTSGSDTVTVTQTGDAGVPFQVTLNFSWDCGPYPTETDQPITVPISFPFAP